MSIDFEVYNILYYYYSRKSKYDMADIGHIIIPAPICQVVTGKQGLYQQINIQQKQMTIKEYKELAENPK